MNAAGGVDEILDASRGDLVALWRREFGAAPPRVGRDLLVRILANHRQWQGCGESRASLAKRLERAAGSHPSQKARAAPGARLVRDWNGTRHVVEVLADGYRWRGETWRSLSAIAREITGTKWSGPRFFGVCT